MKYTHLGFSQQEAINLGLDDRDLAILRWFIDFKDSGKMAKKIFDEEMYYWVKYQDVISEYPIFNFKKDTIYRRFKKMSNIGVLKHQTLRQGGVWSYYTVGIEYINLISDSNKKTKKTNLDINPKVSDINPEGTDTNPKVSDINPEGTDTNPEGTDINPEGTDINPERKTLLPYPSTISIYHTHLPTTNSKKDVVVVSDEQIDILRNKTGLSITDCTTLLKKEQAIARIVALFNYASSKTNVKNIVGYIIRLLDKGFEIPVTNNYEDYYSDIVG